MEGKMGNYYELLKEYALNNENYKGWRDVHTKAFGEIFSLAFNDREDAQIHLTAALINISERKFDIAMPKLKMLESICVTEYDRAAINYFIGLNYEMMGNENKMNEYYENLKSSCITFVFPFVFHPYYRIAKFAQRDMEFGKAVFYYQKALSFYEDLTPDAKMKSSVSQIIYDIATIYICMHEYEEAEKLLEISKSYDDSENQHRTYVTAILYAAQGRVNDSRALLNELNPFLRGNCEPMVNAIFSGTDLHYCVVNQDQSGYLDFWNDIISKKNNIEELIAGKNTLDAQKIISESLSKTLSFMKRQIACQVEPSNNVITVYCKNYHVKTLIAEYDALFSIKPKELNDWNFVSVKEFEKY